MRVEAKNIFYRSLEDYEKATLEDRKQMIADITKKMNDRLDWNYGIDDCYTLASKWFIRLEDWLNANLEKTKQKSIQNERK